jgi:hypothetical protein
MHEKFEEGLSIPVTIKVMSKKNGSFSKGMARHLEKWRS